LPNHFCGNHGHHVNNQLGNFRLMLRYLGLEVAFSLRLLLTIQLSAKLADTDVDGAVALLFNIKAVRPLESVEFFCLESWLYTY
jgi:hypothetical protein